MYQNWFAGNNVEFSPDIEAATADQILPMVKNNLGIGFVPEEFLKGEDSSGIHCLKLVENTPVRSIVILKRRGCSLSIAAQKMWEICKENTWGNTVYIKCTKREKDKFETTPSR